MDSMVVNRTDLLRHERRLKRVASHTLKDLRCIASNTNSGLDLLALLKFNKMGRDPLKGTELNFIEQLNQTFTALASIKAARHIFAKHAQAYSIEMNLGTNSGSDLVVMSKDKKIIGISEVFAAVDPNNNQKLRKDILKVRKDSASQQFIIKAVYFLSPQFKFSEFYLDKYTTDGIKIKVHGDAFMLSDGIYVKQLS